MTAESLRLAAVGAYRDWLAAGAHDVSVEGARRVLAAAMSAAGLGTVCMGVFSADEDELLEAADAVLATLSARGHATPTDRFVCRHCGWEWVGPCVPHEPSPGWTNEALGVHQWGAHESVQSVHVDFTFEHLAPTQETQK